MKKIIILLTFMLHTIISLQAQTVSYEKLDSITSEISKMQSEVNGKTYNNGGYEFELSFPEENFKVFYHNQIASNAIYKKQNGKELLYLTENIDFSKATGYVFGITNNDIQFLRVYFPAAYLKTQLYENGVLVNTISEESLEFFMINKNVDKTIFDYLLDLITSLQIAKGLTTEAEISNQKKDYDSTLYISDAQKFILKYPSSIHNLHLKTSIKQLEEAEKKGEEVFIKFEYFKYYKRGISLKDAKKEFPDFFSKCVCVKYYFDGYLIKHCDSKNSEINVDLYFDAKTNISMGAFGIIFKQAENDGLWSHGTKEFNTLIEDFNSKFGFAPTISDDSYGAKVASWEKKGKTVGLRLVDVSASSNPRSVIWLSINER
jgi:hypothetical protein